MTWSDWFAMAESDINKIPENSGVYELATTEGGVLYFGQTDNLKRRLLEHLNSKDSCICKAKKCCYQLTSNAEELEGKLLDNYKKSHGKLPPCNEISS